MIPVMDDDPELADGHRGSAGVGPIVWIDNWPASTSFMGSVFSIFLLRQFFAQIPDAFDAAKIDGAGHLRILLQLVLPLSMAPLMVIIVLSFIGSAECLGLAAARDEFDICWLPISVGLYNFVTDEGSKVHLIMAGAFLTIVPILVLYSDPEGIHRQHRPDRPQGLIRRTGAKTNAGSRTKTKEVPR